MKRTVRAIYLVAILVGACGDDGNINRLPDAPLNDGPIDTPPSSPGMLRLTPTTTSFGSVVVGSSSTSMDITVSNIGDGPTGTINASISGAMGSNYEIATNGCNILEAGASCTIQVKFSPTSAGAKTAALAVVASPGGALQTTLDGIGILPGALTITPSINAYGTLVTGATSSAVTYTVTNTGGVASGTLATTAGGSTPGEFEKTNDTCNNSTLAPNATCSLTIRFAPGTVGSKAANFSVTGAPGGTVVAAVNGTAVAPAQLLVNPNSQAFGSVVVGSTSAIATINVVNIGGVATTAISQTLQGTDSGQFTVVSTNCAGTILQANSACTLTVRFEPSSIGNKTADIVIAATGGGTTSVPLTGTGIATGQITITPSNAGFANTIIGSTAGPQVFTVQNTGGLATGPLSTGLGGADAAQFSIGANTCNGASVAPTATCTIAVSFKPTSVGAKAASLLVSGTPGGSVTASLSGNALPVAALSITPTSRDFGSVGVGAISSFLTFTVRNVGGTNSSVPVIALTGTNAAQFMTNNDCVAALIPNGTCTVSVRFEPTAIGNFTATVTATGTPGGTTSATIFGQGVNAASLSVNPSNLQFGDTLVGDVSAPLTFLVTNNGGTATGALTIGKTGAAASEFNIVTSTCATLAPGGTCLVTVTFQPTSSGTRNASISLGGSPGGSVAVAVSGNARPRLEIIEVDFEQPPVNPFDFGTMSIGGYNYVFVVVRNNTSSDQTLTLTNDFGIPEQYFLDYLSCYGGKGGDFAGVAYGAPQALIYAEDTCYAWFGFAPTSPGVKLGQTTFDIGPTPFDRAVQQFVGNGVNGLSIVPVTTPPGFANPTSDFGNVAVGVTSPSLTFEVRNAVDGQTTGPINTAALQVQRFQIVNDQCSGLSLFPGGACAITVNFTPTLLGLDQAVLAVSANPGGPASINIQGTGVDPSLLIFNPTPMNFGNVFGGDVRVLTLTVTNPAGAQTSGTNEALSFYVENDDCSGGGCFSILPPTGADCVNGVTTLTGGQSCTVRVRFDTDAAQQTGCGGGKCGSSYFGPKFGQLYLYSDPGTLGAYIVNLFANTTSTISITPSFHDFGTVGPYASASKVFTVHNDSPTPTTIGSAFFDGWATGLQVTASTCVGPIVGNGSCTYTVSFDPLGTVELDADFSVMTLDENGFASSYITGARDMPSSCVEILQNNPAAVSGSYAVDLNDQGMVLTVNCDMVTDGGGYLSLPITGGYSTARVSDFDSCKQVGLQLVVPRTYAHLSNLVGTYGLGYFSIVPGISGTRTNFDYSNGSGGQNCAMNSSGSNACQSDWHAIDNGPWFINSVPQSEPNGDYSVGCWLAAFSFGSAGLVFNDNYCNYSASNYICSDNLKGSSPPPP